MVAAPINQTKLLRIGDHLQMLKFCDLYVLEGLPPCVPCESTQNCDLHRLVLGALDGL